jgi:hypothetical protein
MIKKIFNYLLIINLLLIISPAISFGQTILGGSLIINLNPERPEPFQKVTVSLLSYSFDLDRSKITWQVNGQTKNTQMGLKEFITQAGKNGQKITVKAIIETPNDGIREVETSFTPTLVDLVYEVPSYTPPFYKGKALNPNQGIVSVTAIPELIDTNGQKIKAQDVIYAWKRNGKVEQAASGLGKNNYVFSGSVPIRDSVVEVTASSLDNTLYATKQINITNISPKIVFYENSPIYGLMLNKAITKPVNMLTDEFSVLAVPYYFTAGYPNSPALDYVWTMNGTTVGNQDPKNSFTTRVDKPGSGTANIGLKINNNVRIFQFAENGYSINFQKE